MVRPSARVATATSTDIGCFKNWNMISMKHALTLVVFTLILSSCDARGRLLEPSQRSSLWRQGFDSPINIEDGGLNCGGFWHQWHVNKGKCGICGDPWEITPRPNEKGGKYFNGLIARTYHADDTLINIAIEVEKNHKGYFEFRLCPEVSDVQPVTQECLDRFPLDIVGHGKQFFPPSAGMIYLQARKPENIICERCVLQWKWHTALNWGKCENGTSQIGCGDQPEYFNCADIAILPREQVVDYREPSLSEVFNPDSSIYVQNVPFEVTKDFGFDIGVAEQDITDVKPSESPLDKATTSYLIGQGEKYGVPVTGSQDKQPVEAAIKSFSIQPEIVNMEIIKSPKPALKLKTRIDSSIKGKEVVTKDVIDLPYIGSTTAIKEPEIKPTQDPIVAANAKSKRVKRQVLSDMGGQGFTVGSQSLVGGGGFSSGMTGVSNVAYDAQLNDLTGGSLLSPHVTDMGVGNIADPALMDSLSRLTGSGGQVLPSVPTMNPMQYYSSNMDMLGKSMYDLGVVSQSRAPDQLGGGFVNPSDQLAWVEQATESTTASPSNSQTTNAMDSTTTPSPIYQPTTTGSSWVSEPLAAGSSWVTVAPNERLLTQPVLLQGTVNFNSGWNNQAMLSDPAMWAAATQPSIQGFGSFDQTNANTGSLGGTWSEIPFTTSSTLASTSTTEAAIVAADTTTEVPTTIDVQTTVPTTPSEASTTGTTPTPPVVATTPAPTTPALTTKSGAVLSTVVKQSGMGAVVEKMRLPEETVGAVMETVGGSPSQAVQQSQQTLVMETVYGLPSQAVQQSQQTVVVGQSGGTSNTQSVSKQSSSVTQTKTVSIQSSVGGQASESAKQSIDVQTVVRQGKDSAQGIESEIRASMKEQNGGAGAKPTSSSEKLLRNMYDVLTNIMEKVQQQAPARQDLTTKNVIKKERIETTRGAQVLTTPPPMHNIAKSNRIIDGQAKSQRTVTIFSVKGQSSSSGGVKSVKSLPTNMPTTTTTTTAATTTTEPTTTTSTTTEPTTTTTTTTEAPIIDAIAGGLFSSSFNTGMTTARANPFDSLQPTAQPAQAWMDTVQSSSSMMNSGNMANYINQGGLNQGLVNMMNAMNSQQQASGGMVAQDLSGMMASAQQQASARGMTAQDMTSMSGSMAASDLSSMAGGMTASDLSSMSGGMTAQDLSSMMASAQQQASTGGMTAQDMTSMAGGMAVQDVTSLTGGMTAQDLSSIMANAQQQGSTGVTSQDLTTMMDMVNAQQTSMGGVTSQDLSAMLSGQSSVTVNTLTNDVTMGIDAATAGSYQTIPESNVLSTNVQVQDRSSTDIAAAGMTNVDWDAMNSLSTTDTVSGAGQPRSGMEALIQLMEQKGYIQPAAKPQTTTTPIPTTPTPPTTTTTEIPTTTTPPAPTPPPIIYDAEELTPHYAEFMPRALTLKMIQQMAPTKQQLYTILYTGGEGFLQSVGINPKHIRGSIHTAVLNVFPELRRFLGIPKPRYRPRPRHYDTPYDRAATHSQTQAGQPAQAGTQQGYPAQAGTQQGYPAQAGTQQGYPTQAGTQQGYPATEPQASVQGAREAYNTRARPTIDPVQRAMEAAMTKQVFQMLGLIPEPPDVPPGRRPRQPARFGEVAAGGGPAATDPYAQPYGHDPWAGGAAGGAGGAQDPWAPRGGAHMSPEWAGVLGLGPEPGDVPPAGGQGAGGRRGVRGRARARMMEQMMDMLSF